MNIQNVVNISGGKDSTAMALLAVERGTPNLHFVFADTGHEHPQTYDYVAYLDQELQRRCGIPIRTVRADFSAQIERKREVVQTKWRAEGVSEETIARALNILRPTGNPFLDLCIWKGRFPSARARFCTEELKVLPIQEQVLNPMLSNALAVISWQGVRRAESRARADLLERDVEFGRWEPVPVGMLFYRPLLDWTAADVFAFHTKHGVRWNPLYEQGMGRVGCMPCIHAQKNELREIAKRFPEEIARLLEWEGIVAQASKRGLGTFFGPDKTPGHTPGTVADDPQAAYGIEAVMDWSLTSRGGRQFDWLDLAENDEAPTCSSLYGLCE